MDGNQLPLHPSALFGRLSGPRSQSGRFSLQRIKFRFLGRLAYTLSFIPAELSVFIKGATALLGMGAQRRNPYTKSTLCFVRSKIHKLGTGMSLLFICNIQRNPKKLST
jgi:hypothetical protein